MKKYKRDWEGDTTLNFRMSWIWFVLRPIVHALLLPRTFDVPCSRFFILTLSTAKLMDWFRCWPLPIIVASQAIGSLGFNWLIDPTFGNPAGQVLRKPQGSGNPEGLVLQ